MKVSSFTATKVFGYLTIAINFSEDLTFLTGLNGSGKTTALRLLMGLLAPSLDELIDIPFETITAVVSSKGIETSITSQRGSEGLSLSISGIEGALVLSPTDIQVILDSKRREESHTPVVLSAMAHPVFTAIRQLSTPMFLGLDRRLQIDDRDVDLNLRARRRELESRHRFLHAADVSIRKVTDTVLADVNDLVAGALADIRAAQERLDETLRNQILLDSFRYEATGTSSMEVPTRAALNSFRERQAAIEKAAANLRLPVGELQSALSQFFERITKIVESLENQQKKTKRKPGKDKDPDPTALPPADFFEWVFNSRQADRIFKQIQLLDEYVTNRATLHAPMDRFLDLTNKFLAQTGKWMMSSERGALRVIVNGAESNRSLLALSSGERQLVVMLAHLSLNKRLAESGVFIVDEPELSLHISWQEQFVFAIQQANPNVQLILATHSPAIILDRVENCRSISA